MSLGPCKIVAPLGAGGMDDVRISAAPLPLASGARLGHYEILSALGAGGMSEVYRARCPLSGDCADL